MEKIEKTWGWEHWFANSKLYCGKLIFVKYQLWSSQGLYHYHKIKDETFFIVSGTLQLEYYEDNIHRTLFLKENNSFRVKPGVRHRFTSATLGGCKFIEASTEHFESDSYRCELNDGEWSV
jgi:mannose-6-phosphate isomerase-like protein (cupin superfamily)